MGSGGAQFEVTCPFEFGQCMLRFYSSEEYVAGGWWLGITERNGSLQRTEFLARATATPGTVRAWLEAFIGYELADQLVDSARAVIDARLRGGTGAEAGAPSRMSVMTGSQA
jgi:hypothetical protein